MGILSALSALNDVGLTQAKLDAAIAESTVVKAGVIAKTREAQAYWQSLAPVSDRGEHVLHKAGNEGAIDHPGDYKAAVMVRYERSRSGFMVGVVFDADPKTWWIEYGSAHNNEGAYRQKVIDHFSSESGGKYVISS
jgi:hypothetical protein